MRGTRAALPGAVMAVVAVACGPADDAGPTPSAEDQSSQQDAATDEPPHPGLVAPEEGPYDPDAEVRPDLMEVDPDEASPGDQVELLYPQGTSRGVGFVLEERVEDSWQVRYFLTVPDIGVGDDPPEDLWGSWFPPDNPDRLDWPSVGVDGTIPGRALIPEPATPGEYRICTANTDPNFCAELTITQ